MSGYKKVHPGDRGMFKPALSRFVSSSSSLLQSFSSRMSVKLFIGGLSWGTETEGLRAKFEEFGQVEDAIVIRDRETGRSRGFGFVTYAADEAANAAIAALDGQDLDGRNIRVQRAEQREGGSAPRGGSRGGFSRGGDSGYSRGGDSGASW